MTRSIKRIILYLVPVIVAFFSGCSFIFETCIPKREYVERGMASWYGPGFYGRKTASGEIFTGKELTAAHKTLPFNTLVKVTREDTKKSVVVRINDRGPFKKGYVIDLSPAAARSIGLVKDTMVEIRVVRRGK